MCTLECLFSKDEESRSRFFPLRLPKGNLYFSIFVCVTVCVFYIRAAAAARDRAAAAVVGAWPNIWLRHHQTRYFFFSISLFENQREGERERSLFDGQPSPPQIFDTMMADIEIQTTSKKFDCFLFHPQHFFFHYYFHKWDFSHDRSDLVFQTSFFPLCISLL